MLRMIADASPALVLLQTRLLSRRARNTDSANGTDENPTSDAVTVALQRGKQALTALRDANSNQKAQRQDAARQKIERLKQELKALRATAGIGDPKATARQLKRISAELAAAAKEYAAAGGGDAAVGTDVTTGTDPATGQGGSGVDSTDQAASDQSASGQAASETASPRISTSEGGGDGATTDTNKTDSPQGTASAKDETAGTGTGTTSAGVSEVERHKAEGEIWQKAAGEIAAKGQSQQADDTFAADVRRLYAEAKALLALERQRARAQNRDDAEMRGMAQSIAGSGDDIEDALKPGAAGLFGAVNLQV